MIAGLQPWLEPGGMGSVLFHSWIGLVVVFTIVWALGQAFRNAGVVDLVWAFCFVGLVGWLRPQLDGWTTRVSLVTLMVAAEYGRLGWYIAQRVLKEWPKEDARYALCRQSWGKAYPVLMWLAYQLQALLIVALFVPIVLLLNHPHPGFGWIEAVGFFVWMMGFLLETVADMQLHLFKANPQNHGGICQVGVWSACRHPNYFGQWLMWVGLTLMALTVSGGWISLYVPVLMYVFLTRLTGITITEDHMLKTRGEAYAAYQRQTPSFFPIKLGAAPQPQDKP